MRRAVSFLLLFLLLLANPVIALAEEPGEEPIETVATPVPEDPAPSKEPAPATPMPSPSPSPEAQPIATPAPETDQPVQRSGKLLIDNKNVYENMGKSYEQGYVPIVRDGSVLLVLPLVCETSLEESSLRVSLDLGDTANGPFVIKNYEKTVKLGAHKMGDGKKTADCFLITFTLPLKADRTLGVYPVTVKAAGREKSGGEVSGEFQVFVTVDGKDPNATPVPEIQPDPTLEPVVLGPKLLVQSYEAVSLEENAPPGVVNAGDRMRVRITLKNTSETEALQNLSVTAGSPGEFFVLGSTTDSTFIGELAAAGTVDVTYEYTVKPETPAGQYAFPVSYDFAYHKGMTSSGSGSAQVLVHQPLELEFSLTQMPAEAVISDTVEVQVQAINLSHAKAANVRASIEGDGLLPSGTAFIGDLEGGTSQQTPLQIQITGLTQGDSPYGVTQGTVTFLYADEDGREHEESKTFTVNVKSPFSESDTRQEDDPGQWWIIMAVIGAGILALGGIIALRFLRNRRGL